MTASIEPNVFSTKSDTAYAEVRRRILSGDLQPGSVLAQYELAESMRMSITPLREALRRLRGEGLIELDVHKETRVAPLNHEEAQELVEVRIALEPAAAELAAHRRTDSDIVEIRGAAERLVPVTRDRGEQGLIAHSAFHRAIYRASHNSHMIALLDALWDKSDRYRRMGLMLPPGAGDRERDYQEHLTMVEMVVARDADGLRSLMRQHISLSLTVSAIEALERPDSVG